MTKIRLFISYPADFYYFSDGLLDQNLASRPDQSLQLLKLDQLPSVFCKRNSASFDPSIVYVHPNPELRMPLRNGMQWTYYHFSPKLWIQ